eukprot:1266160-Rhodomonas_salina.1
MSLFSPCAQFASRCTGTHIQCMVLSGPPAGAVYNARRLRSASILESASVYGDNAAIGGDIMYGGKTDIAPQTICCAPSTISPSFSRHVFPLPSYAYAIPGTDRSLPGTDMAIHSTDVAILGTEMATPSTDRAILGTDGALLGTDMAMLITDPAFHATHFPLPSYALAYAMPGTKMAHRPTRTQTAVSRAHVRSRCARRCPALRSRATCNARGGARY